MFIRLCPQQKGLNLTVPLPKEPYIASGIRLQCMSLNEETSYDE